MARLRPREKRGQPRGEWNPLRGTRIEVSGGNRLRHSISLGIAVSILASTLVGRVLPQMRAPYYWVRPNGRWVGSVIETPLCLIQETPTSLPTLHALCLECVSLVSPAAMTI
jgi:hypothetical protein